MKGGEPLRRGKPMQRGKPLARGKGLDRGSSRMRRTPVNPVNRSRTNPSDVSPEAALEVRARSRDICERCKVRPATDMHHRVTRKRGGPGDVFNLAHLCSDCHHVWAHGHLEDPWYVRGYFLRGLYVGPDKSYRAHYGTPRETPPDA